MNTVVLTVSKDTVYQEVAKTTAYTGAKMKDEPQAYDRIPVIDADKVQLDRFWREACHTATQLFMPFLVTTDQEVDYVATLQMSSSYDANLNDSVQGALGSMFINHLIRKWFEFTNRGDLELYQQLEIDALRKLRSMIYYRKKPKYTIPQQ